MTATRTITRFVIALCPPRKVYLASIDPVFREGMNLGQATIGVPSKATQFNTFEAALDVAKCITGWGGAQRVEEIAVEVEDTRSTLDTPEARIEVRDAATAAYINADDGTQRDPAVNPAAAVAQAMRELGLQVATIVRPSASCAVTVNLADHLGNLLTLDWDPMQDGFSYETEGDDACDIGETEAQHEAEPETCPNADPCCARCGGSGVRIDFFPGSAVSGSTSDCECTWEPRAEAEPDHGCAGNCKPLSPKAARALRKWGKEKCQRAWHLNRLRGEGLTVCSIETGIPVRSVNSAINAWQEVWAQLFVPQTCSDCGETNDTVRILDLGDGGHALCSKCNTPDIIPCDGCDSTDAEPCGDSEGHAFCAACRAKSQDAPKAADPVTFDPAFIDAVLGRDDLTFDQTPLTPEQAKHARAALTAALRSLVLANLPRLASSALTEARDNT